MKSKLLKIIIVFAMLTFVYMTIVDALSFTATMTPSSTTVAEATEFTVTIKVSNLDVGTNGINSLSGYLTYDKNVFETISESSVEPLNGWSATYSADNGKITMTKSTFTNSEQEVFQITFRTKSDVSGSSGTISYTNIIASNSEVEISASNISTSITVGTAPTNTTNTTNTNNSATIIANTNTNKANTNTNTNTNTNVNTNTNNNAVSSYVNSTNTSSSDDIPYTGAEDTIIKVIFVLLVVAFIFYIKFERINKEMK